ncbi:MAG: class I SAM-dependent methyltransferase [Planctomycetes bacterium]|nr:class I SAM-dependent methyltransferase [Planctomycetota bacterium]
MMNIQKRIRSRLRATGRRFVRFFGGCSGRDAEDRFCWFNIEGSGLRILDVGGCGSMLALTLAQAGHRVTVIDVRGYPDRHKNLEALAGSFLESDLPSQQFDVIILLSSLEHFGFGGYGDAPGDDADFLAIKEVRRVLKERGVCLLTVPYSGEDKIVPGCERWYSRERLGRILDGFRIEIEEYWRPSLRAFGHYLKWFPCPEEQAAESARRLDFPSMVFFKLRLPDTEE